MDAGAAGHAWQWLYPPLQSHASGWLDVGDGHAEYWEVSGNPAGAPALFLHGGPGAGCSPSDRRWFDPSHYRIVLFDQRGAGRSRPQGGIEANTTGHLVQDIEALRRHLEVDRWLVFGGSWGATLALAYAERFPHRVAALVLRGVFLGTRREIAWLYAPGGAAALLPAAWERLVSSIPCNADDILGSVASQLHCGAPAIEHAAALAWLEWEQELMESDDVADARNHTQRAPDASTPQTWAVLAAARVGVHFARHAFFMNEGQLLAGASLLRDIPGVIVQGGRDLVTPPAAAQALHRAWPGSTLHLVDGAGHASSHPAMARQLVAATDSFRETTKMDTNNE
jgi:proline iminopeptidase